MGHGSNDNAAKLSITWPFTFAGLCLTVALCWFCLGFALRDRKLPEPAVSTGPIELQGHYTVFWGLLILGAISVLGGIAFNLARERNRG
jgi:hypothetical protein